MVLGRLGSTCRSRLIIITELGFSISFTLLQRLASILNIADHSRTTLSAPTPSPHSILYNCIDWTSSYPSRDSMLSLVISPMDISSTILLCCFAGLLFFRSQWPPVISSQQGVLENLVPITHQHCPSAPFAIVWFLIS